MSAGVELAWTEIKGPQGGKRVRVFIERRGDRVGLTDCERVNDRLSALLELEDPVPGSYILEVSTPGLDRPLRTVRECARFVGHRVRVTFRTAQRKRQTLSGTLRKVEDGAVCLDGPGGHRRIAWAAVLGARLDPDFAALLGGGVSRRRGRRFAGGRGQNRRSQRRN